MTRCLRLLPLLLLAACASDRAAAFGCPETGFMRHAARAAFFASAAENPGPGDVSVRAQMTRLAGTCRLQGGSRARMDISFDITASKAPRAGAIDRQNLSYFIAVLGPEERVLQRENFYATVFFDEGGKGAQTQEHRITIPLAAVEDAAAHTVAIGFTLTPQQLEYNKARRE